MEFLIIALKVWVGFTVLACVFFGFVGYYNRDSKKRKHEEIKNCEITDVLQDRD